MPYRDPDGRVIRFMLPGPTVVPPAVTGALTRPMINHRGPAFTALNERIQAGLRAVFRTAGPVVLYPGSGTGALESAVVNCFSPGDRVLSLIMGVFGERFAAAARAFGCEVDAVEVPPGSVVTPDRVDAALAADTGPRPYRGVLVTHNETSTGALLDLEGLSAAAARHRARGHPALVLVDAVSSLAGARLETDAWDLDVVVTGSQKALMCPPGLALMAVGPRARTASAGAAAPRFYWDWRPYLEDYATGRTPYTPALPLWWALDAALEMIGREGVEAVWERHRRLGASLRRGLRALGLEPLAPDACASPTVTAVLAPPGRRPDEIRAALDREHGVVVAGGQGALASKVFRIGHMGCCTADDVEETLAALGRVLGVGA